MKKTLAALAVLGAFAGSAAAADVQLYGVVDEGFIYTNTKVTDEKSDNQFQLGSGLNLGSRWGLKGTEDLGNGYKVGFKLESGFNADTGTLQENRLFRREAGLTLYGPFGSLGFAASAALPPRPARMTSSATSIPSTAATTMFGASPLRLATTTSLPTRRRALPVCS